MIFIALVAVAVWLADLRLAVALPLVALAWLIAAVIEYLAWRSARGSVAVVEAGVPAAAAVPPPAPEARAIADTSTVPGSPVCTTRDAGPAITPGTTRCSSCTSSLGSASIRWPSGFARARSV